MIFSDWTPENMIIRTIVALILGAVIGFNRESKGRVAGIKTNAIVCVSAALVMMTAQYMDRHFPGCSDLARLGAQVISGVGFLGVGTIIVSGHRVRGLTTAAGLWACACIGIAVGIGFVEGGVMVTLCLLFVFICFPWIERKLNERSRYINLYVEMTSSKVMPEITRVLNENDIKMTSVDFLSGKSKDKATAAQLLLHLAGPASEFRTDIFSQVEGIIRTEIL